MFTPEELTILRLGEVRAAIDENIDRDPAAVALDKRIESAAAVASQVKRLQRARTKLPSYYAVRAVLPSLAFEQSSSEECAARKRLAGVSVLDLTCGLGVDSAALARRFERVVSVERDAVLAEVARENFARLGVANVEVVNAAAEEFLEQCTEHFDWCLIDPDRRGARGEKLVRLEECSPDVVALRGRIGQVAGHLCIKCSPLFDVAEAPRIFGQCSVECVSLGGECKEVNIYIDGDTPTLSAVAIGFGEFSTAWDTPAPAWSAAPVEWTKYRYLILPDAALQHARLVASAFAGVADTWSDRGVALAVERPEGPVLGRIFEVERIGRFDPKRLKKELAGRRIEIYRRDFPLSNAELCRRLGVREGADERWCFTCIAGERIAIKLKW